MHHLRLVCCKRKVLHGEESSCKTVFAPIKEHQPYGCNVCLDKVIMAFYIRHTGFRPLHLFNAGQQSNKLARIRWCYDQNNVVLKELSLVNRAYGDLITTSRYPFRVAVIDKF